VESRYLAYAYVLEGLAIVLVATAVLFAYEVAKRRIPATPRAAALLLAANGISIAAFLAVVLSVGPGHPSWDRSATAALGSAFSGALRPFAKGLALAASFPFTLAALFGLFAWALKRESWKEAYFTLATGAGMAGLLIVFKLLLPRAAPASPPFFQGATAFPNDTAALVPVAIALLLFLRRRLHRFRQRRKDVAMGAFLAALLALTPVLAGQAWLSDVLAGVALAGFWLSFSALGLLLVEGGLASGSHTPAGIPAAQRPLLPRILDRMDAWGIRVFANATPWLWGLVGLGIALRVASYWVSALGVDAYAYGVMGNQFLHTGTFLMPWGDVHTYQTAPVYSHHYPPLYPVYLAGFYKVLGFSIPTTHIASIVSSLAALGVTYACSRDLYGRSRALIATAAVAVNPLFVQNTGQGYSENMVLLLFVATLWAILKSLDRPWHIVSAGVLAGLGYLTKSSMGYFFILAGLGGLAWRLHWKGAKVLREPAYLAAIVAFGALVLGWALRNLRLFGTWETSRHISDAYRYALGHPLQWGYLTLVTFVFYATLGYLVLLAILPWLPRLAKLPKLGSEHDSGLWLALGLPLLLTAAIDAGLWLVEREFFAANVRYIGFVMVPAAWLLLRHVPPRGRGVRIATLATFALLVSGSLFFGKPSQSSIEPIADDLASRMGANDSVAFVDVNVHGAYRFYFQLTHNGTRSVPVTIACVADPLCPPDTERPAMLNTTWVVMVGDGRSRLPPHYTPVPDSPAQFDPRFPDYMSLWRHA
jgi:hypothetical protein